MIPTYRNFSHLTQRSTRAIENIRTSLCTVPTMASSQRDAPSHLARSPVRRGFLPSVRSESK
jgi:hypothetical protein